ncbi:MAG: hypothetical protein MUP09_11265 [Thiovulaceae bacterium]|nr:hypothetical protein [Sulfurimonadaceae bacterium]
MNFMQFLKALMLTALFLSPLAAQEVDAATKCDTAYDACMENCDAAEESSEKCSAQCDEAHVTCLSAAQAPEQEEDTATE